MQENDYTPKQSKPGKAEVCRIKIADGKDTSLRATHLADPDLNKKHFISSPREGGL